ncbi:hypothetical protein RB595_001326 [Gaeumannomyces hyphopodioides]
MELAADPDDQYISSEDSDFAPDEDGARDASPEDADDEDAEDAGATKRKRPSGEDETGDAGFENSGDEAVIQKAKNKRRRKGKEPEVGQDDESGGQGGLIKTRSQRALEKSERKAFAASGQVTIDADLLWAEMNRPQPSARPELPGKQTSETATGAAGDTKDASAASQTAVASTSPNQDSSRMVKIKRTYNFAGKVHTEEKLVPWDSAEAKLYMETTTEDTDPSATEQPKRRPRKAFRSIFEPAPEQLMQRTDLNLGIVARMKAREGGSGSEPKKLTTLEKSRVDWAGYVDKEGIQDELKLAGKSKHSYTERQGFLARSEARREDDARKARLATRV